MHNFIVLNYEFATVFVSTRVTDGLFMDNELISLRDAARMLDTSVRTVQRFLVDGTLPYVRVGARRKLQRTGIAAFIAANTVSSKPTRIRR